jgi:hypothetical protein
MSVNLSEIIEMTDGEEEEEEEEEEPSIVSILHKFNLKTYNGPWLYIDSDFIVTSKPDPNLYFDLTVKLTAELKKHMHSDFRDPISIIVGYLNYTLVDYYKEELKQLAATGFPPYNLWYKCDDHLGFGNLAHLFLNLQTYSGKVEVKSIYIILAKVFQRYIKEGYFTRNEIFFKFVVFYSYFKRYDPRDGFIRITPNGILSDSLFCDSFQGRGILSILDDFIKLKQEQEHDESIEPRNKRQKKSTRK